MSEGPVLFGLWSVIVWGRGKGRQLVGLVLLEFVAKSAGLGGFSRKGF